LEKNPGLSRRRGNPATTTSSSSSNMGNKCQQADSWNTELDGWTDGPPENYRPLIAYYE